jgi:two-component system response regulator
MTGHARPMRPILLVEDSRMDAELLTAALEDDLDIERIVHVRDGVEALAWLERAGTAHPDSPLLPALILLDLKIPRMTGMELLSRIKSEGRWCRVPVVLMTSSEQESDLAEAYQLGVNAYVRKPLAFEAFVTTVREVMSFWLTRNLLPVLESEKP